MPTTPDLPKARRSAAKSAMSLLFPFARSITAAMKPRGGGTRVLIQSPRPAHCGSKRIRYR